MKTYLLKAILILAVVLHSIDSNAQQRENKSNVERSYQKVVNSNDKEALKTLELKFKKQEEARKKRVLEYVKTNKEALELRLPNKKGFSELQDVGEDGTLYYYTTYNTDASKSTRAKFLNTNGGLGLNLDGNNMLVHVWDAGGVELNHQEFDGPGGNNRVSIGDGVTTANDNTYHAQHVTGTIVASGFQANAKGMAWKANAKTFSWSDDVSEATVEASNGMILSNHSYGRLTTSLPDEGFGKYDTKSRNFDEIMYNAPYYLAVVATGNDGAVNNNGTPLDGQNNRDKLPGWIQTAKNSLGVANANDANIDSNGNLVSVTINPGSSQGPTDDYRIKPDITGNGTLVYSSIVEPVFDPGATNLYASYSGTSMASPNVCGSLLLLQEHSSDINGEFMKASTLKGLVLHTADDVGINGPDPIYGWGLMNSKRVVEVMDASKANNDAIIKELTLNEGESYSIPIQSNNIDNLQVSISWTDPAGVVNTGVNNTTPILVNDLDLRVDKNNTTSTPWKFTGVNSTGKGDNKVDPYERIDISNASGVYVVTVTHKGTLLNNSQNFSLIITGANAIEDAFVTTWKTNNTGASSNNQITIPTHSSSSYSYSVKWGDGNFNNNVTGPITHTYASSGTYNVVITGDFPRIFFNDETNDKLKLLEVKHWGDISWKSMANAFNGCSNLDISASDKPNLDSATSLNFAFKDINSITDFIADWDVSNISKMKGTFKNVANFDQNLGEWDVSNVIDMTEMFAGVTLSTYNYDALIKGWNSLPNINSNVTFSGGNSQYCSAIEDRNNLTSNLGWTITDAGTTCSIDEFITTWQTNKPGASNNNQIIIPTNSSLTYNYTVNWGDGNVDTNVTGNITHTYTNEGTYLVRISGLFPRIQFVPDNDNDKIMSVEQWGNNPWTTMKNAFYYCSNLQVNATDAPNLSNATSTSAMFVYATSFNASIAHWDVSTITNMSYMFARAESFNQDLSSWDVSNVTSMSYMFNGAYKFNQSLGAWDISNVNTMSNMFFDTPLSTENYDDTLIGWHTLDTANEETQIPTGVSFRADGIKYCTSETERQSLISDKGWTILDANESLCNENGFISLWKTDNANSSPDNQITIPINSAQTYNYTVNWGDGNTDTNVTGPITHNYATAGTYYVSITGDFPSIRFNNLGDKNKIVKVVSWGNIAWATFKNSFNGCSNLIISATDTPNLTGVTNFKGAFEGVPTVSKNLEYWDVSGITNFSSMFKGATIFEADISGWTTSGALNMTSMFENASGFNQNISAWDINKVASMDNMLDNSGLSETNYDSILIGWLTQAPKPNVTLGASGLKYCAGKNARELLINDYSWMFVGDNGNCPFVTIWQTDNVGDTSDTQVIIPIVEANNSYTITWEEVSNPTNNGVHNVTGPVQTINFPHAGIYRIKVFGLIDRIVFNNLSDRKKILDIESWGTAKWTSMNGAFYGCNNLTITATDTPDLSNVTNCSAMFRSCQNFNVDISHWNMSNVQNMTGMFRDTQNFNQDLNAWNTSAVTNMSFMFNTATAFNQNIGGWDISQVTNVTGMLGNSNLSVTNYDNTLIGWNNQTVQPDLIIGVAGLIYSCEGEMARYNLIDSNNWQINSDTSNCTPFVTTWDNTDPAENNEIVIPGTGDYIINWEEIDNITNTGVESASGIHTLTLPNVGAYRVNISGKMNQMKFSIGGDSEKLLTIDQWGAMQWADMAGSFYGCSNMTYTATDTPDLSNITSFKNLFRDCSSFNGDINNWQVNNIDTMISAFKGASNFNQPLNSWIVDNVTDMRFMFDGASLFNQPLDNWNVGNVVAIGSMFKDALAFNQNLDAWTINDIESMAEMFNGATTFDQSLGAWDISLVEDMSDMLNNSGLSSDNYEATLNGWWTQNVRNNVELGAVGLKYCEADTAKLHLTSEHNWNIIDDGITDNCFVRIRPKVFLQGASINPNVGEEHLMRDDLRVLGLIPTISPYTDGLTCDASVFTVTGSDAIVDWVWVEFRTGDDNALIVDGTSALLQRDGDVVGLDGVSEVTLHLPGGGYKVAIKHRNHLATQFKNAIYFNNTQIGILTFFNSTQDVLFGVNAQTTFGLPTNKHGMWAGNVNGDIALRYQGADNDTNAIKDAVLADVGNTSNSNLYSYSAYSNADVNMDGTVRYQGAGNDSNFIKDIILTHSDNLTTPSNLFIATEQLPEN